MNIFCNSDNNQDMNSLFFSREDIKRRKLLLKIQRKINTTDKMKKKGFTLVELIAVIAIIAVLAAALTPKLAGYINESKKVAVLEQAREIVTAYNSVSLKDETVTTSSKVADIITKSNGLIDSGDIDKLADDCTVESCINAVEGGEMTLTDGKLASATAPVTP